QVVIKSLVSRASLLASYPSSFVCLLSDLGHAASPLGASVSSTTKVDKDAELVAQWNYCTLSQEILRRPIVACELGRLYNKDAVIEFLLDKSSEKALGKAASHIKSIKNVTELRLSDNPAWEGDKGNTKGDKHDDLQRARFICPVVGLEMNGRHRFCFLRCCGCVFSERALREIKAEVCHTEAKENIFYFNNNTCSAVPFLSPVWLTKHSPKAAPHLPRVGVQAASLPGGALLPSAACLMVAPAYITWTELLGRFCYPFIPGGFYSC
uniref:Replication termination factor 2 n=1 Tax=Equus caballus TaxID=9796 RepID=A0A9L0R8Y8_HORSE